MIKEHQVTPSPSQLDQWEAEARAGMDPFLLDQGIRAGYFGVVHRKALRLAFAAGADQELEGCVKWLKGEAMTKMWSTVAEIASALHASRRPKPPSLKEQALEVLKRLPIDPEAGYCPSELDTIRRALEALPG